MPKRLYTCCITLLLCIHVIPQGSFAMELLWYYYSCIWLGVEQSKTGGFFSFGVSFKEKCRNFNIHLDVLFKLICMKNMANCITGIIRFLFFFIFTWFDFNLTMFLHSRVLPIHVNLTPRLTEILCFQMLCFVYSYPIHVFFLSLRLQNPPILRSPYRFTSFSDRRQRKPCVVCPAPAALCSTPAQLLQQRKGSPQQGSALQTVFRCLGSSSPPPAATATALPSSTEQKNLRTTQFRKRGRSLSCLLTLYIGYYYLLLYSSNLSFEMPMGLISSQQRIVSVYYLVHLGSSIWFMLGGQQTIDDPLSIFLN